MLNKLSPFFAIIFSYFLLKEKIKPYQLICVIVAFIGALFILRPGFDSVATFPAFIGLIGGMGAGLAYTNVRIASIPFNGRTVCNTGPVLDYSGLHLCTGQ